MAEQMALTEHINQKIKVGAIIEIIPTAQTLTGIQILEIPTVLEDQVLLHLQNRIQAEVNQVDRGLLQVDLEVAEAVLEVREEVTN